jgi:DNA-binding NarL/FixJ family response regulator
MKIVIVEDSPLIQAWLASSLRAIPGVLIVGCATSEREALTLIDREQPDVVMLDLSLSPGHGFNVLKSLRAAGHGCKVLVLTNQDIVPMTPIVMGLGADGIHDKNVDLGRVTACVAAWAAESAVAAGTS